MTTRPEGRSLYIDSDVARAYRDAQCGDLLTREELAVFSQIYRSAAARDTLERQTGVHMAGPNDAKALFEAAKRGEIDLTGILRSSPTLQSYANRTTPFNID